MSRDVHDDERVGGEVDETFGPYELRSLIGRGGMGEVWRAHDRRHERDVAVKRITVAAAEDEHFRARFLREARVSASLESLHVVPLYDFGEVDGRLYLVMRLVDGGDLEGRIRDFPRGLPPARAVAVVGHVADALDAAHSRGLVHRDVKPANVLLTTSRGEDFAYLVDFGIAKAADATGLTGTGTTIGTTAYMAPELFAGQEATPAADVYALGCVLFEALTGRRAFGAHSVPALIREHLYGPVPHTGRGDLAAYEQVLARALAKDPRDRFRSAGELAAAAAATPPPAPEPSTWDGPGTGSGRTVSRTLREPGPRSGPLPAGPPSPRPGSDPRIPVPGAWSPGPTPWPGTAPAWSLPPAARRPRRRPWLLAALVLLLVVTGGGVAITLAHRTVAPAAVPPAPAPPVTRIAARPLPVAVNGGLGVALSPDGTRAYVAPAGSDRAPSRDVQVVDLPSGRTAGTIPVGRAPAGVITDARGTLLYVTVQSESAAPDSVTVVDPATGKTLASVPTGMRPWFGALTPDGRSLYVADSGYDSNPTAATVTVLDTTTRSVVRSIPVGLDPFDVAITPDGRKAYVSNYGTTASAGSTISVIDTASGTVRGTVGVGYSDAGLSLSPDGRTLYVAENGTTGQPSGAVSVVDTATDTVRTVIRGDRFAPIDVVTAPDGTRVLAVTPNADTTGIPASVSVIDTASNTITATVPVGRGASHAAFSPDGRRAYVTTETGLWVVDVP